MKWWNQSANKLLMKIFDSLCMRIWHTLTHTQSPIHSISNNPRTFPHWMESRLMETMQHIMKKSRIQFFETIIFANSFSVQPLIIDVWKYTQMIRLIGYGRRVNIKRQKKRANKKETRNHFHFCGCSRNYSVSSLSPLQLPSKKNKFNRTKNW